MSQPLGRSSVVFGDCRSPVEGRRAGLAAGGDSCGKLVQPLAVAAVAGHVGEQPVEAFEAVELGGAADLAQLGVRGIPGPPLRARRAGDCRRPGSGGGLDRPLAGTGGVGPQPLPSQNGPGL